MIVIHDGFGEVMGAIDGVKETALRNAGMLMVSHARVYVPVDTGNLRDSLAFAASGSVLTVGSDVDYAPYAELGVMGRPGTHFLRNAISMHTSEYAAVIAEAFGGKGGMKGGEKNGDMEGKAQ